MQVGTYYIDTIKQSVPMDTERAYTYRNVWKLKIVKYNDIFFQAYEFYKIIIKHLNAVAVILLCLSMPRIIARYY